MDRGGHKFCGRRCIITPLPYCETATYHIIVRGSLEVIYLTLHISVSTFVIRYLQYLHVNIHVIGNYLHNSFYHM